MILNKRTDLDKRRETRINTQIEADLQTTDKSGTGVITNISLSGIQIECGRKMLFDLMPNIQRPNPREPLQLFVSFNLPDNNAEKIQLQCQMMYARRLAKERFLVGGTTYLISAQDEAKLKAMLG